MVLGAGPDGLKAPSDQVFLIFRRLLDTVSITVTVRYMPTTLSLRETVDLAQRVLDENRIVPRSRRAASELSERNVRWYTTAGILDAPGREGHSATYGRRHLLQLLYTRQAQARGEALEKVRLDITGLSTEELAAQVGLDLALVPLELADVTARKELAFWEREPAEGHVGLPAGSLVAGTADSGLVRTRPGLRKAAVGARSLAAVNSVDVAYTVRVGPVSVSLGREPSAADITAITKAAQPLLACLAEEAKDNAVSPTPTPRRK